MHFPVALSKVHPCTRGVLHAGKPRRQQLHLRQRHSRGLRLLLSRSTR
jgi:hypothetical protein